jgi:hypothetical protein
MTMIIFSPYLEHLRSQSQLHQQMDLKLMKWMSLLREIE